MSKRRRDLGRPSSADEVDKPRPKPEFELRYALDVAADINNLDGSVRKQLKKILEKKLAADPEGYGLPLRALLTGYWQHEFATHRIIYRIYHEHKTVAICAVGPRKQGDAEDIYKQLEVVVRTGRLARQIAAVLENILPKRK